MKKQETAFKLGFKVGDFMFSGAFPGIIISDLRSLTTERFKAMVLELGHSWPVQPYSKAAQKAVAALI